MILHRSLTNNLMCLQVNSENSLLQIWLPLKISPVEWQEGPSQKVRLLLGKLAIKQLDLWVFPLKSIINYSTNILNSQPMITSLRLNSLLPSMPDTKRYVMIKESRRLKVRLNWRDWSSRKELRLWKLDKGSSFSSSAKKNRVKSNSNLKILQITRLCLRLWTSQDSKPFWSDGQLASRYTTLLKCSVSTLISLVIWKAS